MALTDDIAIYDPSSGDTPPGAYICKKTHVSSADIPLTDDEYWSKANSMDPILSALVLAHAIKANKIDVRDLTADSAFIDYLQVKKLIAGDEDGQRVEILPENRSVDIYDSSGNIVSSLEGNTYANIDSLFDSGSGNLTITAPSGSQEADSSSWGEGQTVALSAAKQISVPAKFTVPSGVVTLALSADESSIWSNNLCGVVFVQLSVYSDSECSSKIGTYRLVTLKMTGTGSKSVNLTGLSCNVATAGWVRMELFLKCFVYEGKTVTGAAADIGWSGLTTVAYSGSFYVARYFANGLVLGSGKNDYICIYRNPNGEMAFNMRGSGLDMHLSNINGLLVRKSTVAGTYRWMNILGRDTVGMPLNVLAIGEIYTSGSTAWISGSRTCDSNTLSASRVTTGQYKVTIPTAWGTDYYVYLTTYGRNTKDVPRFASVYSQGSGYFYVDVKDANGGWSDDCKIRFMIVKYGDFGGSHYNPTL